MAKAIIFDGPRCGGKTTLAMKTAHVYDYKYFKDHKTDDDIVAMYRIIERVCNSEKPFVLDRFHLTGYVIRAAEYLQAENPYLFHAINESSWLLDRKGFEFYREMTEMEWYRELVLPLRQIDSLIKRMNWITIVLNGSEPVLLERIYATGREIECPYLVQKFLWEKAVCLEFNAKIYIDAGYSHEKAFHLIHDIWLKKFA